MFWYVFLYPKHIPREKHKIYHWISQHHIICLKGISEEGFSFNGNFKVITTNIKFFTKVPTQKPKYNRYENQIYITDLKSFSN